MIGGVAYWVLNNMADIMQDYWQWLLGYVVVAGLISFAVIYYYGGVANPRAFDLIQWTMQMFGVILIYMSTPLYESSLVVVLLALLTYRTPLKWVELSSIIYSAILCCLQVEPSLLPILAAVSTAEDVIIPAMWGVASSEPIQAAHGYSRKETTHSGGKCACVCV